jgi:hypothetical protein
MLRRFDVDTQRHRQHCYCCCCCLSTYTTFVLYFPLKQVNICEEIVCRHEYLDVDASRVHSHDLTRNALSQSHFSISLFNYSHEYCVHSVSAIAKLSIYNDRHGAVFAFEQNDFSQLPPTLTKETTFIDSSQKMQTQNNTGFSRPAFDIIALNVVVSVVLFATRKTIYTNGKCEIDFEVPNEFESRHIG